MVGLDIHALFNLWLRKQQRLSDPFASSEAELAEGSRTETMGYPIRKTRYHNAHLEAAPLRVGLPQGRLHRQPHQ